MAKVIASLTLPVDIIEDVSAKTGSEYRCLELKISDRTTERIFISNSSLELLEMKYGPKSSTAFKTHSSN